MRTALVIVVAATFGTGTAPSRQAPSTTPPPQPGRLAPPSPLVRTAPVVVVRLTGDLVARHLIARLRDELAAAAQAKAELVVLSIEGRRFRPDVARGLADVVATSPVPVAALLGPGSPVGGGQALVGLGASTCWISARTQIECEAADVLATPPDVNAAVAPEPTPAPDLLTKRGLPAELAGVLLAPAKPMYAAWHQDEPGSTPVVTLHEGAAGLGAGTPGGPVNLVTVERTGPRTLISSDTAVRLGVARSIAGDPGQVLRQLGLRGSSVTTKLLTEDLTKRRAEMQAEVAAARSLIGQALDRLGALPKGDDPADQDKRRRGGSAAVTSLQHAGEAIARAEALAKNYPELLGEPPAGTSTVGMTPEGAVKAWYAEFKDVRGDLTKAAERAARAADPKR
jgi:hypothetical protein